MSLCVEGVNSDQGRRLVQNEAKQLISKGDEIFYSTCYSLPSPFIPAVPVLQRCTPTAQRRGIPVLAPCDYLSSPFQELEKPVLRFPPQPAPCIGRKTQLNIFVHVFRVSVSTSNLPQKWDQNQVMILLKVAHMVIDQSRNVISLSHSHLRCLGFLTLWLNFLQVFLSNQRKPQKCLFLVCLLGWFVAFF